MKIAISTDGDYVSAHFGRCPAFTIVEIENNKVIKTQTIENPGHHPGFLPEFLYKQGVEAIIAGGIGMRARALFDSYGIKTIMGVEGKINDVITSILNNTLKGGENLCQPGAGKGYGLDKIKDNEHNCRK